MKPDDFIQIVQQKCNEFSKLQDSFNVICGIVQVNEYDGFAKCIVLGSGTKCTPLNSISKDGTILNDCHAEVLARRGLIKYLYDSLKDIDNSKASIFDRVENKFRVKSGITFHLVTSTSFCGDASIISSVDDIESKYLASCGDSCQIGEIGRTGAKSIEDEDSNVKYEMLAKNGLPVREVQNVGSLRRKPGKGSPSHSMSCSDKMIRWCALGIQGVLLSQFISNPIVFKSIIVANCKRSRESFHRSIVQRLNKLKNKLRGNEYLRIPQIEFASLPLGNLSDESSPSHLNFVWVTGINSSAEISETIVRGYRQGFTRKIAGNIKRSSLSKQSFMEYFFTLVSQWCPGFCDDKSSYNHIKNICLSANQRYAASERAFFDIFSKWLRTDRLEYYNFHVK